MDYVKSRFKPGASRIKVWSITATPTQFI